MKAPLRRLLRIFLTGCLAALPLVATVFIFVWGARVLYAWLGPNSLVGQLLSRLGLGVTGSEVAGYGIGVGLIVAAIFFLGLIVQTRLKSAVTEGINAVMQRIPVVSSVYDLIRKVVDLLSHKDEDGTRSMRPVWLRFGGPGSVAVLGLLPSPDVVLVQGERYLGVLVPTSPVPMGGALLYVPEEWVSPAPLGVEGLTSIYVSMGVTSGQHLGAQPR
jgi:uncharacterized membrane protein